MRPPYRLEADVVEALFAPVRAALDRDPGLRTAGLELFYRAIARRLSMIHPVEPELEEVAALLADALGDVVRESPGVSCEPAAELGEGPPAYRDAMLLLLESAAVVEAARSRDLAAPAGWENDTIPDLLESAERGMIDHGRRSEDPSSWAPGWEIIQDLVILGQIYE